MQTKKYNIAIVFLSIVLSAIIALLLIMVSTTQISNYKTNKASKKYVAVVEEDEEENYKSIVDWVALIKENSDVCGWLKIYNTNISVPVVQSSDNEYYLRHDIDKVYTYNGTPFLDYQNSKDYSDPNTIIYGHNMRDGKNFGELLKVYKNAETAKNNPYIHLYTQGSTNLYLVVGAFYTNANPDDDNDYVFPYNTINFYNSGDYSDFILHLQRRFIFNNNVDLTAEDNLLMLSTCAYDFKDERFVVVAKKIDNKQEVEGFVYTDNANPLYPQRYYDKHNISNPHKGATKY